MRKIGLIGGMSWESTAEYYRLLNQGVQERLGGLHSARVVVSSVDFAPIEQMQQNGDWAASGDVLAAEARALQAAGAELIMIGTNTMHKVYDQVAAAVGCPVLHLGDVTARAVRAAGLDRIGLLATRYTMEQDFYRQRLSAGGVESLIPDEADRQQVQRIIYDELCVGVVTRESRDLLIEIGQRLVARGARGIVLGCTELELSVRIDDLAVPIFPTTALHCRAALDMALEPHS
ncbi:aspartate racemase [Catenulispora sp. GP43]|uniref:aspartate/glutamate racemase family protein n=1 Tax=Catenulispora sp. GP43 TaxID=3156263 RepID=UPI003518B7FC